MRDEKNLGERRALRQYLESLRLAGVTHVPCPVPVGTTVAKLNKRPGQPRPSQSSTRTPAPSSNQTEGNVVTPARSELPNREDPMSVLGKTVAECQRCQELAATRTQTVLGVGDLAAQIMFIGEAPGADEDRQGEPFVGAAGRLLNSIITACQLTRKEVYICNILKCRPPGNRTPSTEEADNCREYLDAQIAIVQPEYIVCWGAVAAQNLLGTKQSIGRMRGTFYTYQDAKVVCTYHPSYLLRNPSAKKQVWEDMKFWRREMGVEL